MMAFEIKNHLEVNQLQYKIIVKDLFIKSHFLS